MVDQLLLGRLGARGDHHPGDDPLAEVVVRLARRRRLGHGGMLEQRRLDLTGAHAVPARLDQVGRAAPDDPDVAVSGPGGQVAGAKPAVVHRRCGRVRPVQIAEEDVRPSHLDLADRIRLRDDGAVVVHDPHLHARERQPDVARSPVAGGPHGAVHERLGEPVALDDALAADPLDALVLARGQRRRARDE